MDENTEVSLAFDKEKLYKNMVAAKADWLYELPQWKEIYSEEELKKLYKEQKESTTIRKEKKIGRNDPCPCGSGKKYKKCCGRQSYRLQESYVWAIMDAFVYILENGILHFPDSGCLVEWDF